MAKCTYILRNGKRCPKNGQGNPPTCDKHYNEMLDAADEEDEDEDDGPGFFDGMPGVEYVEEVVDVVIEHPRVQGVFNKAGSLLDRFAHLVDAAANGRPPQPPPGPQATGEPPPRREQRRQEREQRRQSAPPPPRTEEGVRLSQAYLLFGWTQGRPYTEVDVKKRKHELNRVYHPDNNQGSDEMVKRINAAADLLISTLKKR